MAASGYTPIQLYRSSTASAAPSAGNLADGELAINTADVALYAKNSGGAVKRIINNPAGLKYPTADGTNGYIISTDGSGNLSFIPPGSGPMGPTGPTGPTGATGPNSVAINTTPVTGGTTGYILFNNAGTIGNEQAVPVANGGTGQTTATTAFNALAPSQAGNAGLYLQSDGTNALWATVSGAGFSNGKAYYFGSLYSS